MTHANREVYPPLRALVFDMLQGKRCPFFFGSFLRDSPKLSWLDTLRLDICLFVQSASPLAGIRCSPLDNIVSKGVGIERWKSCVFFYPCFLVHVVCTEEFQRNFRERNLGNILSHALGYFGCVLLWKCPSTHFFSPFCCFVSYLFLGFVRKHFVNELLRGLWFQSDMLVMPILYPFKHGMQPFLRRFFLLEQCAWFFEFLSAKWHISDDFCESTCVRVRCVLYCVKCIILF